MHILCKYIKKGEECPAGGKQCCFSHNKKKFEDGQPKANAEAAAGAFGAPPPGLKMVNTPQDSVPNPFQAWLGYDGHKERCSGASVALRDIQWSEVFLARMWTKIVAAQQWSGVFSRSILAFAREWFNVCGARRQRLADSVLVMWCYSGKEPMSSIVGLIPPVPVMLGQEWPKGTGKGKPKKGAGGLLRKIQDLPQTG